MEFQELKKRYWDSHFWEIGFDCWSAGNISDEMVNKYLEHHGNLKENNNEYFIIKNEQPFRLAVCQANLRTSSS